MEGKAMKYWKQVLAVLTLVISCARAGQAGEGISRVELDQRLKSLEKKIREMEPARTSTPSPTSTAPTANTSAVISAERGGTVFNSSTGGYNFHSSGGVFGLGGGFFCKARGLGCRIGLRFLGAVG